MYSSCDTKVPHQSTKILTVYYLNIVLNRTVQCVVANLSSLYIESINLLPGNLKDKCLYLMSKRGCITDANLPKVKHDLKTFNIIL